MPRITDTLPHVPARTSVTVAFAALDSIQTFPAAERMAGVAVLFSQMCDVLGLDVSQVIDASRRRAAFDDTFYQREVKALRDYINGEMR